MERYHIFKLGLAILFYAAYCVRPMIVAAVEVEVIEDTTNKTDVAVDDYYVYYQGVEGKPGVDFPVLSYIPRTSFSCKNMESGYYADLETDCQVFHICEERKKISFLCPNGTIFQQSDLICEWWFKVNCTNSPTLYTDSAEQLHDDQIRRKSGRRVVEGHDLGKHGAVMRLEEHSSITATQNGRKFNVVQSEANKRISQQSDNDQNNNHNNGNGNSKVRMRVVVHKKSRNDLNGAYSPETAKHDSQVIKIQNNGAEQIHHEKKRISNRLDKKIQNSGIGTKINASPVYKLEINKDAHKKGNHHQSSDTSDHRSNYENYQQQSPTDRNRGSVNFANVHNNNKGVQGQSSFDNQQHNEQFVNGRTHSRNQQQLNDNSGNDDNNQDSKNQQEFNYAKSGINVDLNDNNNKFGFSVSTVSTNDLGLAATGRPQFKNSVVNNQNYNDFSSPVAVSKQYSTTERSTSHFNSNHQTTNVANHQNYNDFSSASSARNQYSTTEGSALQYDDNQKTTNIANNQNYNDLSSTNSDYSQYSTTERSSLYFNGNQNTNNVANNQNSNDFSSITGAQSQYSTTDSSASHFTGDQKSTNIANNGNYNDFSSATRAHTQYSTSERSAPNLTGNQKTTNIANNNNYSYNPYSTTEKSVPHDNNNNQKSTTRYNTETGQSVHRGQIKYQFNSESQEIKQPYGQYAHSNKENQNQYSNSNDNSKNTDNNPQITHTFKNSDPISKISYQSTPITEKDHSHSNNFDRNNHQQNSYQNQPTSTVAPRIQSTFIQHFESESTTKNIKNSDYNKNQNFNAKKSEIGKDTSVETKNQQIIISNRNDLLNKRIEPSSDLEETQIPQESSSFLKHPYNTIQQDLKKTTNPYPNHRETYSDIKDPKIYNTEKYSAGISSVTPQYLTTQSINNGKPFIGSRVGVNVYAQPTTTPKSDYNSENVTPEELFKSSYAYTVGSEDDQKRSTTPEIYSKVSFGTKHASNINNIQSTAVPFNVGQTDKTLPPVTTRTTVNVPLPSTEKFNVGRTDKTLNAIVVATNEPIISRGSATTPEEGSFNTGITGKSTLNYGASINLGHSSRTNYQQNSVTPNSIISYQSTPAGVRKSSTNEFDFNIGKTDKTLPPVTERTSITASLPTTELFNVGKTDKSIQPVAIVTNEQVITRGSATIPDENSFNVGTVSVTSNPIDSSTKRIIDHATVYGTFAKGQSTTSLPPTVENNDQSEISPQLPISSLPPISYEARLRAQQLSKPRLILTKVPQNINLNPNVQINGIQSTVGPTRPSFGYLPNGQILSLPPSGPGLNLQSLLLAKQLQLSTLNPNINFNNIQSSLGSVRPTQPTPIQEETTTPLPVAISTVDTVSPDEFFKSIKTDENIELLYNGRIADEVVRPRPFKAPKHEAITRSPKIDYSGSNKLSIDITPTTPTYKTSSASPFSVTNTETSKSPGSTLATPLVKYSSSVNENIDNMINALMKISDDDRSSETPRPGLIVPPSAGPQTLHTLAVYFANALDGIAEEKGMKGHNLDEAEKERLTNLLTQMTMNRYNELFPEENESSTVKDKVVETSTLSTRDASDDEENDLEGQHSKNPVQTPKVRQLAKVFTQALSAYLDDPHSFKKVLHDVRPTEPPTLPLVEDTTSPDDELLNFSDADSKSSYPPIYPTIPSARPTWGYILALNNTPNLSVDDKNSLNPDENLQGSDSQSFVPQFNNVNVKENEKTTDFTTARSVDVAKSQSTTNQFKFNSVNSKQTPNNFGFTTARSVNAEKPQSTANQFKFNSVSPKQNQNHFGFTTARSVDAGKSQGTISQFKFTSLNSNQNKNNVEYSTATSVDAKPQLPANHWTASPDATKLWQTSLFVNPVDINNDFKTTESSLYINVDDTREEIVPDKASVSIEQHPHSEIKYELRTLPKLALNSSQVHGILIDFMNTTKSDESSRLQRILRKLNTTEDEFLTKMREIEGNPLTRRLILLLISECGVNATKDIQTRAVPLEQLIKLSATNTQEKISVDKSEALRTSSSSSPYAFSRIHLSNPPSPSKSSSGFKTLVDPNLNDDDEDTRAIQLLNSLYSIASKFG